MRSTRTCYRNSWLERKPFMAYISENELRQIFDGIASELELYGLDSSIALIRDYMMKISISENEDNLGILIVDYSPKKRQYSLRRDSSLPLDQFEKIKSILDGQIRLPYAAESEQARAEDGVNIKDNSNESDNSEKKDNSKDKDNAKTKAGKKSALPMIDTKYHAYVDGSFFDGKIGYGSVILEDGRVVEELSGRVDDPEAFSARQVGGEIRAVIETLEWCKKHQVGEIALYFDFMNIEKWATGAYKTNTPMTKAYKQYMDTCGIKIFWVKVDSHTGVALNDRADELAKAGALSG